jgi:hypothetical protein
MNIFFGTMVLVVVSCTIVHAQKTIGEVPLPSAEYSRIWLAEDSFGGWLRKQPLKKPGSAVLDYRDRIYKSSDDTTVAFVMDIDVSGRRLEQCMDILIRLYTNFLWENDRQEDISMPLPGGYWLNWSAWREGLRPHFKSVQVSMKKTANEDSSFKNLESYLRTVYAVSHTQQFYHSLVPVERRDVKSGDFIVLKGSKSHAVLITDLAQNTRGDLIALIGHGDTPACQFHLLAYTKEHAWFPLNFENEVLPLPIRRKMTWQGLRRFNMRK